MRHRAGENPLQHLGAVLVLYVLNAGLCFAQHPASPPGNTAGPRVVESRYGRENLDSLSLSDSQLRADNALLGEKDERPEFTRELLRLGWRDDDPVDLYVIRPAHVQKPPVVLYLYSYPSDTRRFIDNAYCRRVTRDGFAAVGFVSALTGHRYHGRPMKQWFVSELRESLVLSVHDVQMIVNYLAGRGDLDMSSLGMFGAGSGGSIAIMAAAVDPRIRTLDLLDPWGDWPDWLAKSSIVPEAERQQYVTDEFLKQVAPFDPVQWFPLLKAPAIRLQHVMDDSVTPPAAKRMIEAAGPRLVQRVHYDDTPALFKASTDGALFNWIKQQLRTAERSHSSVAASGVDRTIVR